MGVKLGLSNYEKSTSWECWRMWSWGRYFDLRGTR